MEGQASPLSLDSLWPRVRAAMVAEREALVPIALALIFLPQLVLARLSAEAAGDDLVWWLVLVQILAAALGLWGQVAITRIVLVASADQVGQHLAAAGALLPRALLLTAAIALVLLPLVMAVALAAAAGAGGVAVLFGLIAFVVAFWLVVRLIIAMPLLVVRGGGVRAALADSWAMTGVHQGRLIATILLFSLAMILVFVMILGVGTAIGALLGLAAGAPAEGWGLATWVVQLLSALAAAAVSVAFTVMVAEICRVLTSGR